MGWVFLQRKEHADEQTNEQVDFINGNLQHVDDDDYGDDDDDDDDGLPANSHHDKNPPWWEFVSNEYGGNMPVTKSHH